MSAICFADFIIINIVVRAFCDYTCLLSRKKGDKPEDYKCRLLTDSLLSRTGSSMFLTGS